MLSQRIDELIVELYNEGRRDELIGRLYGMAMDARKLEEEHREWKKLAKRLQEATRPEGEHLQDSVGRRLRTGHPDPPGRRGDVSLCRHGMPPEFCGNCHEEDPLCGFDPTLHSYHVVD